MAEEFGHGAGVGGGHAVEAAFFIEQAIGGEDVDMGMEKKVVAKGMDGDGGAEASVGEVEAGAEGVAEGVGGGLEEEVEEVTAFAKDAAQHFRDGEDELAVGDGVADGLGDPCAGLEGAALMAGGAEVAGFAGEGEEVLVAAVRADVLQLIWFFVFSGDGSTGSGQKLDSSQGTNGGENVIHNSFRDMTVLAIMSSPIITRIICSFHA